VEAALQFVLRHGYAVLFASVFADQVGLPLPALPILLGIGSLSAQGHLTYATALVTGALASLLADVIWYILGRMKGSSVLRLLCRLSLEPDTCVRRTEQVFERHGAWVLLYAKFVPGLSTVAPPLAGTIRLPLARFLAIDGMGALLWMVAFTGLGYVFSDELETAVWIAARLGTGLLALLLAAVAARLLWKAYLRRSFLRETSIARVSPEEVKSKMDRGAAVTFIDLRHELERDSERVRLPGALHILPEEIERRHGEIPKDREWVLYCT
jgi:membrane protein DedA with SNARE-associated domain